MGSRRGVYAWELTHNIAGGNRIIGSSLHRICMSHLVKNEMPARINTTDPTTGW